MRYCGRMANEEAALDAAISRIRKLASDNAPLGARINAEQEYSIAYQVLVKAGRAPQIRLKYREI